ncbi:DUF2861 family protein [Vibrio lentus]|nr:DUF2861 family protein [Vibrio lentus]
MELVIVWLGNHNESKLSNNTILYIALCVLNAACGFTDACAITSAYQSLLDDQPQVAWQELQIARKSRAELSQLWLPVKQEILSRTQCGSTLEQKCLPTTTFKSLHPAPRSFITRLSNQRSVGQLSDVLEGIRNTTYFSGLA